MKKPLLILGIVIGAILTTAPVWGLTLSAMLMRTTLSQTGVSDPRGIAQDVGNSLMAGLVSFALCPVGVLLIVLCIVFLTRKPRSPAPPAIPQS